MTTAAYGITKKDAQMDEMNKKLTSERIQVLLLGEYFLRLRSS